MNIQLIPRQNNIKTHHYKDIYLLNMLNSYIYVLVCHEFSKKKNIKKIAIIIKPVTLTVNVPGHTGSQIQNEAYSLHYKKTLNFLTNVTSKTGQARNTDL